MSSNFISGKSFLEIRNSLGVVKRQEKELNSLYYEDDSNTEEMVKIEQESKEELHRMFTEETLALAIIGTAFVALLLGFFLGMFVTRTCSPKSAHQQTKSPKSSSASSLSTNADDLHKYSVTTISSHNSDNQKQQQSNRNEFDQASKISVENENSQFKSLPPQFSIGQQSQQPMSLNPNNLDRQRYVNTLFENYSKCRIFHQFSSY